MAEYDFTDPKWVRRAKEESSPLARAYMEHLELERRALEELARTDPLTTLPNRLWCEKMLEEAEAAAAHPHYGSPEDRRGFIVATAFDVERFTQYNEPPFNHGIGDSLLVRIAEELDRRRRPEDFLARMGGDEFFSLAFGIKDPGAYRDSLHGRLVLPHLEVVFDNERYVFDPSVRAGVYTVQQGDSADEIYARADQAERDITAGLS